MLRDRTTRIFRLPPPLQRLWNCAPAQGGQALSHGMVTQPSPPPIATCLCGHQAAVGRARHAVGNTHSLYREHGRAPRQQAEPRWQMSALITGGAELVAYLLPLARSVDLVVIQSSDSQGTTGAQQYDQSGRQGDQQTFDPRTSAAANNLSNSCGRSRNDMDAASCRARHRHATSYIDANPVRQIFVKTDTGRTLTVRVSSWHNPVATVTVRDRQRVPADQQRLVFAGQPLSQGGRTLAQYGIGQYSTLEMRGRLRGGMPAKNNHAKGDTTMTSAEPTTNPTAANSSLLAWSKWVQGPYQALLKSSHFEQQLDEWELGFLEALTEQEVPKGAIAAMATRAGLALGVEEATRAMAAYNGRRHLQLDFIAGVFRRVPHKSADETLAATTPKPAPAQTHPTVLDWARWVAGPYAAIASRSTYAADLDKWEVDMEEYLMEAETTTEQLAAPVATASLDFDRTTAVRALGAYAAQKNLRPDFNEFRFISIPPAGAPDPTPGGVAMDQSRMREIVALLSAQKLEVEHMRQSLIPPLTPAAVDRFLTEAWPYAWMTSLAAVLNELALEDTTGAWAKQALPATVWRVLDEELRAKRQGRPSAPAVTTHPGLQGPMATMQPQLAATGSGTVCFNCGGRGHIARMCPWKAQGGQIQQMGP